MGCGHVWKKTASKNQLLAKHRISIKVIEGDSIKTARNSDQIIEFKKKVSDPHKKICLKLQIFEDFQDVFPVSISGNSNPTLTKYQSNLNYIKSAWVNLKSAFSYFDQVAHGCCISNFSLKDGLIILLISSLASGKKLFKDIKIQFDPPYIIFEDCNFTNPDTDKIVGAWNSLARLLEKFNNKKIEKIMKMKEKFVLLIESYQICQPLPGEERGIKKSEKNIRKLIGCCDELNSDLMIANRCVQEFFLNFDKGKEELVRLGNMATDMKVYCGEGIVHYVLMA